ncbi:MAG: hypothetical protein CVT67_02825 [Actinobacteria bacterium HGW-Actinobacteria-7]|jgi:hypothetical protein|nr:MAG: hypothetical protein CVT67_02825 [Actinobacteria bacterium HGW-Actinobacteria-7]
MSTTRSDDNYVWGQAIQEAMAARGCEMTLEESRQFVRTLLGLFECGAFVFVDAEGNDLPWDQPESRPNVK